jgi:hypothetical protein
MKTLKTLLLILTVSFTNCFYTQNSADQAGDANGIVLATVVPNQIEELNESSRKFLANKLNQIVSKNGVKGSFYNQRFIITTNVNVISKDLTASAPPMHAYNLEVSFFIGDGTNGTLFSSTSMNYKGVGQSETKAYRSALKSINTSDARFERFITEGKNKIIEFYNAQCDIILKEAEMLQSQNNFEGALAKLLSVPSVCKDCFEKTSLKAGAVYQKYLDRQCDIYMNKAKAIWASNQSEDGAREAAELLSLIDPDAKCATDASKMLDRMYEDIKKRVKDLDQREWDYKLKEQLQESERIEAMKQVGVAYGENQPQNVTYNYRGWF